MTVMTKQANAGQTVFDIALITYGDLDGGLALLLGANPGIIALNGTIPLGGKYKITPGETKDTRIAAAMTAANPTTDTRTTPVNLTTASGGFWATTSGDYWITTTE
jgi:phage tail protein X